MKSRIDFWVLEVTFLSLLFLHIMTISFSLRDIVSLVVHERCLWNPNNLDIRNAFTDFFFFFLVVLVWTPVLAKQVLLLEPLCQPFFYVGFFQDMISRRTICLGMILNRDSPNLWLLSS
jgi:hypothetical protein